MNFKRKLLTFYQTSSIKKLTVLAVVLIICVPILTCGVYFYVSLNLQVKKGFEKNISSLYNQTHAQLASAFKSIEETAMEVTSSTTIQDILNAYSSIDAEYELRTQKQVLSTQLNRELIFNAAWVTSLIESIFIFTGDQDYIYATRSQLGSSPRKYIEVYKHFSDHKGRYGTIYPPSENDPTLYYCNHLRNVYSSQILCDLIIGVDEKIIANYYKDICSYVGLTSVIFTEDGLILSHSNKALLGQKIPPQLKGISQTSDLQMIKLNGESYYTLSRPLPLMNLTYCILYPVKNAQRTIRDSMTIYIIALLMFVLVGILISYFIAHKITSYFNTLNRNFNYIQKGDYTYTMPTYLNNELNQVSLTFNNMTQTINRLVHEKYEVELKQKEIEFEILQSQINPHFLINTLASLSFKAKMCNDESLYQMLKALIEILRVSLYTDNKPQLTLEKELSYIDFYLSLQQMRFSDRLKYAIYVEDERILDYSIPKFSIQNFVENAVIHGLEPKIAGGYVHVYLSTTPEDDICIIIEDDGVGFDPHTPSSTPGHSHIGIYNCDSRIKLLYGNQYGVSIESTLGKGTTVTILIPKNREDA